MPRLTRQKEAAEVDRMLQDMVAAQPDFILIHAYSDAQRLAEFAPQMPFYVAPTLNVFNQESLRFWQQHGASAIFLSQELTLAQIRGILRQYDGSLGVYACGRTETKNVQIMECGIGHCGIDWERNSLCRRISSGVCIFSIQCLQIWRRRSPVSRNTVFTKSS